MKANERKLKELEEKMKNEKQQAEQNLKNKIDSNKSAKEKIKEKLDNIKIDEEKIQII